MLFPPLPFPSLLFPFLLPSSYFFFIHSSRCKGSSLVPKKQKNLWKKREKEKKREKKRIPNSSPFSSSLPLTHETTRSPGTLPSSLPTSSTELQWYHHSPPSLPFQFVCLVFVWFLSGFCPVFVWFFYWSFFFFLLIFFFFFFVGSSFMVLCFGATADLPSREQIKS